MTLTCYCEHGEPVDACPACERLISNAEDAQYEPEDWQGDQNRYEAQMDVAGGSR